MSNDQGSDNSPPLSDSARPSQGREFKSDALLCYCRPGFEPELAAELNERAALAGHPGYARTERNSGYVEFLGDRCERADARTPVRFADLRPAEADPLSPNCAGWIRTTASRRSCVRSRVTLSNAYTFGELWVEHPDSDEARPLAGLARSFGNALRPVLRKSRLAHAASTIRAARRLHVVFLAGDHVLLAIGDAADSAPWPLGIPRLRMHADAPSRSALKLEEALMVLLNEKERERLLRDGMRGADLGAAPGGWSWVLMRNGLHVTFHRQRPAAREPARQRPRRTPARGRLPLAATRAAGLDGVRHGRTTASGDRAHGDVAA